MKAYLLTHYGKPLELHDVPNPVVGPGEVVIDVAAVSLNPVDAALAGGALRAFVPLDLPARLGFDVAGTVSAVGDGVTHLAVGDRVMSRADQAHMGTFAERVAVDASVVVRTPAVLSDAEAASLPLTAVTAWQALVTRGHLEAGQKVLVHAGAGGVGTMAIQIAHHLGAEVATTVSTRNVDYVRTLGADVVIDRRAQDFSEVLSGYDLVVDGVGASNVAHSLRVLRPGGTVVGLSTPPDPALVDTLGLTGLRATAVRLLSRPSQRAARARGVHYVFHLMEANGPDLERIRSLVEEGALKPQVGRTLPFEDLPEALQGSGHGAGEGRSAHGKTVLVRESA